MPPLQLRETADAAAGPARATNALANIYECGPVAATRGQSCAFEFGSFSMLAPLCSSFLPLSMSSKFGRPRSFNSLQLKSQKHGPFGRRNSGLLHPITLDLGVQAS